MKDLFVKLVFSGTTSELHLKISENLNLSKKSWNKSQWESSLRFYFVTWNQIEAHNTIPPSSQNFESLNPSQENPRPHPKFEYNAVQLHFIQCLAESHQMSCEQGAG